MKLKIKAIPWIIGQLICVSVLGLNVDFAIISSVIISLLALTKNIDWI